MKSTFIGLLLLACGIATQASAQALAPASGGERAAFLKCFFECKEGPVVQGVPTFQEITTIMLTNQSPDDRQADVYYFNGKEQCLAHSAIALSSVDLDELNVCHSLLFAGVMPPPAGLVEIIVSDPTGPPGTPGDGVYAWGKNVIGKFRYDNFEPFEGRVTGVGKYECRLVPDEVGPHTAVDAKCQPPAPAPVEVNEFLVEETDDVPCACDADLNNDSIVGAPDQFILATCFNGVCPNIPPACVPADINCDCVINNEDLAILVSQLGAPPTFSCDL